MSRSLVEPSAQGRRWPRRRADPLIALINVVFLLLVFLMIAGTISPRLSGDVTLIDATDPEARTPPDAAVILPDGRLMFDGAEMTAEAYAGPTPRRRGEYRDPHRAGPQSARDRPDRPWWLGCAQRGPRTSGS
jgi:hypothetical protein